MAEESNVIGTQRDVTRNGDYSNIEAAYTKSVRQCDRLAIQTMKKQAEEIALNLQGKSERKRLN